MTFRAREVILKLAFVREWSSEGGGAGDKFRCFYIMTEAICAGKTER